MLDLQALEGALSAIGALGKGEISFEVNHIPVTLRVLTADEEIAVQKYSREPLEGDEGEPDGLTLLERYKRATLSYAIVQVGPNDLRDVESIATGEMTEKGVPIRISKVKAVRQIIDKWARVATMSLFQKYLELVQRMDAEADQQVQFNIADLDAEIARVEKRLNDLKSEKERNISLRQDSVTSRFNHAIQEDAARARAVASAAAGSVPEHAPVLAPQAPQAPQANTEHPSDQFALPPRTRVPPPTRAQVPLGQDAERQRISPPVVKPRPAPIVAPPEAPQDAPFDSMMDSMGGGSEEMMAAESARLMAARRQALEASRSAATAVAQDAQSVIPTGPSRRAPPHQAANLSNVELDMGAGAFDTARSQVLPDGREAVRLGATPIGPGNREVPVSPTLPVRVNSTDARGSKNPRFRKPQ